MSWDVYLKCPCCNRPVQVDNHEEGGTYAVGGTTEADLNITYNYGGEFATALGYPFGELNGKKASDVIAALENAVVRLGIERDDDYWKPTPGNAGYALSILLKWAKEYPYAYFEII